MLRGRAYYRSKRLVIPFCLCVLMQLPDDLLLKLTSRVRQAITKE